MKELSNETDRLSIAVGQSLIPAFGKLSETLLPLITQTTDFVKNHKELVGNIIIGTGALLGLRMAILGVRLAANALMLTALFRPSNWRALGAGISTVWRWGGLFVGWLGRAGSTIARFSGVIMEGLVLAFGVLRTAISAVGVVIAANPITAIVLAIASAALLVVYYWDSIAPYFWKMWDASMEAFAWAGGEISSFCSKLWNDFWSLCSTATTYVTTTCINWGTNALQALKTGGGFITTLASELWNDFWTSASTKLTAVTTDCINWGSNTLTAISTAGDQIKTYFAGMWNDLWTISSTKLTAITTDCVNWGSNALQALQTAGGALKTYFTGLWDDMYKTAASAIDWITNKIKDIALYWEKTKAAFGYGGETPAQAPAPPLAGAQQPKLAMPFSPLATNSNIPPELKRFSNDNLGKLPDLAPLQRPANNTTTNHISNNISVVQQPNEDGGALARRITAEMEKNRAVKKRSSQYDY
jgi:hypothetical protein